MNLQTDLHEQLIQILDRAEDLPTIPLTAIKILKMDEADDYSVEELQRVLLADQAVVAKLLRIVNSAYYGFPKEISSIRETINILGFVGVKNAVLLSSSKGVFKHKGGGILWLDSIEASLAIEALYKYFKKPLIEAQFLIGLLHNIGRAIFAKYFYEHYRKILEMRDLSEIRQEEHNLFGMDHREAGGVLAKNWELPLEVISGIQGNHTSMSTLNFIDLALDITYSSPDEVNDSATLSQFVKIKKEITIKKANMNF